MQLEDLRQDRRDGSEGHGLLASSPGVGAQRLGRQEPSLAFGVRVWLQDPQTSSQPWAALQHAPRLGSSGLYADAMERTRYVEPITGELTERWFQLSHAVGDVAPIEHVPRDRQQARVLLLLERIERDLREYRSLDVEMNPPRALFEGCFD